MKIARISVTSRCLSLLRLPSTDMLPSAFLCFLFSCVLLGQAADRPITRTLYLDNGYDAGTWGEVEYCEDGSFVTDIEVAYKDHTLLDVDENAVNTVKLYCATTDGVMTNYVTSTVGKEGEWKGMNSCSDGSLMTGMRAKVMPNLGLIGDDEAVQNVEMECEGGSTVLAMPEKQNSTNWSSWDSCGKGSAVCGIRVRYEAPSAIDDDVAIADMTMYCCSVK
ncbi:vitelline membrane outer layer protein 1 homolog [Macrobrachium nipponense]|uniref:vitelline membrane outer layer protein 1 homolog n=1 Tax=Macrobrachium nipponense TaxID=159736 RepID=UPI0030C7F88A